MNMQSTRLADVVERVLEDLRSRADHRHTQLHNAVPPDLTAHADGDRLQQVFFNLVDNAIKYGRPDGVVEVGARLRDDGQVEAWVKDNGAGIPADSVERVFERFYRVDKARSREQGGTGLGLAIVKHIVQSHNGEVWLKSNVGEGSTFFFTLPAAG